MALFGERVQFDVLWAYVVLAVVVIIAAVTDIVRGKIPNAVTYPAIAVGLIGHTLVGGLAMGSPGQPMGLSDSAMGLAVGFGFMLIAWLAGGIGGGDAKLMGAIGALAGWRFVLASMFYGFAVAAVMAVAVMIRQKIVKRTLGRIWRFFFLALLPGKKIDPASADSPKIALGVALCIGCGLALAEAAFRGPLAEKLFFGF